MDSLVFYGIYGGKSDRKGGVFGNINTIILIYFYFF